MNKKIFKLHTLCITLSFAFNCGHYRQTRKITNNAFGTDHLTINDIWKIGKIANNQIIIVAATLSENKKYEPLTIRDRRCFILDMNNQNDEIFYQYTINSAEFTSDCDTEVINILKYKIVDEPNFEINSKSEKKEIIRIKILNSRTKILIKAEMDDLVPNKFPIYTLKSPIYKKNNPSLVLLYPLALPYDIFAATLHSIGMHFFIGSLMLGALSNHEQPLYKRIPLYFFLGTYRALSYLDEIK
ncbi:hypothetical protein CH372_19535 [Leptospira meyeri]|uniref:hypothetical protein n=1 Tax=Leptospira meyeri TaxID=29508 RepID=UPI000C2AE684|nr:hypothetical protein [Leptospira meyeri]PKA10410.1 hypothetical protein CH372_19535 [Leptospira meyeri]